MQINKSDQCSARLALTLGEISELVGVSPPALLQAIRRQELAAVRISPPGSKRTHYRVTVESLNAWLGIKHHNPAGAADGPPTPQ